MKTKETLQLRHQLCCNGIEVRGATYDAQRHHVLTYDTARAATHMLRLFSLRRELKSAPLFDDSNPPPPLVPALLQQHQELQDIDTDTLVVHIHFIELMYAANVDVYVCVYAAQSLPAAAPKKLLHADHASHNVLFLEPASLKKLVGYPGSQPTALRCVWYDDVSSRLVLASKIKQNLPDDRPDIAKTMAMALPVQGAVSVLRMVKRFFRSSHAQGASANNVTRTMLSIEKAQAPMIHADALDLMCGSQHLRSLFGAGTAVQGNAMRMEHFIMEWRQNNDQKDLVPVRRSTCTEAITAMATTEHGQWLLSGHRNGAIRIWDTSQMLVVSALTPPVLTRPTIIDSISITRVTTTAASSTEEEETMVFTTDRTSGTVKHWRFCYAPKTSSATEPAGELKHPPLLEFAGSYQTNSHLELDAPQITKPIKQRASQTFALCVSVDMGMFLENMLLVLQADIIHVLKVQCIVQVLHTTSESETVSNIRMLEHQGDRSVLCVGTNQLSSIHIVSLYPSPGQELLGSPFLLVPPPDQGSSIVSSLETFQVNKMQYAVFGWSTGSVEVHAVFPECRRLLLLQDSQVNEQITALMVVTEAILVKKSAPSLPKESGAKTGHEWGGLLTNKKPVEAQEPATPVNEKACSWSVSVFAGTADGQIIAWKSPIEAEMVAKYVLHATSRNCTAHSTHIVQLRAVANSKGESIMLSLGADGMLKCWIIPTMTLASHLNTASGAHMSMLTCMEVMEDYIVTGYDAGTLAVWHFDKDKLTFNELTVSSSHERRVSRIAPLVSEPRNPNVLEFLTCSLDMNVIMWVIAEGSVKEKRYFEVGSPIVDVFVYRNHAVIGLPHELCQFAFNARSILQVSNQADTSTPRTATTDSDHLQTTRELELFDNAHSTDPDSSLTDSGRLSDRLNSAQDDVINIPTARPSGFGSRTRTTSGPTGLMTAGSLRGWKTDATSENPLDREVMRAYLHQYASSFGTNDSIPAESLSTFLTLHHLHLVKRSSFKIRKCLRTLKIDPKSQLTVDEACTVLVHVQASSVAAPEEENAKEKTNKRRIVSTASHDPTEPPVTKVVVPKLVRPTLKHHARRATVTYNIMGEKSIKWATDGLVAESEQPPSNQTPEDIAAAGTTSEGTEASIAVHMEHLSPKSERRQSTRRRHRTKSVLARYLRHVTTDLPEHALLARLHLSVQFRPHWTKGYCWCKATPMVVVWNDPNAESDPCTRCRKRRHVLKLDSSDYKPQFTLRAVLDMIADIYTALIESSHDFLFKKANESDRLSVSLHGALMALFKGKYGMHSLVETKLKLLYVAMCHYVREVDAVAVFCELLGMFQTESEDDPPAELVALCVSSYAWLHSREMIKYGDDITRPHDKNVMATDGDTSQTRADKIQTTRWQFIQLDHALLCAQENLVYPLVNPSLLQNILTFMAEYSQIEPTSPTIMDSEEREGCLQTKQTLWVEAHRLLRLIVGEWKHQNQEFRAVETFLFTQPMNSTFGAADARAVLEKLRLLLSCFIFYDYQRTGVIEMVEFEKLMQRLRYLWPNERLTAEQAATDKVSLTFENAMMAIKHRFGDFERDGHLCYLDFWALLYVVGAKIKAMLKFRELPSFCKDYKLEVTHELQDVLVGYMTRACGLLLPRGFVVGKSTADEEVSIQHRKRVGGLHDGLFHLERHNVNSFSMNELIASTHPSHKKDAMIERHKGLYLEGSTPALRQTASMSAMERYQPITHDDHRKSEEVVQPVREVPTAPDSQWHVYAPPEISIRSPERLPADLSLNTLDETLGTLTVHDGPGSYMSSTSSMAYVSTRTRVADPGEEDQTRPDSAMSWHQALHAHGNELFDLPDAYTNSYIQFPDFPAQLSRVEYATRQFTVGGVRRITGHIDRFDHSDDEDEEWQRLVLQGKSDRSHGSDGMNAEQAQLNELDLSKVVASPVDSPHVGLSNARPRSKKDNQATKSRPNSKQDSKSKKSKASNVVMIPAIDVGDDAHAGVAQVTVETAIKRQPPRKRRDRHAERDDKADEGNRSAAFRLEKWDDTPPTTDEPYTINTVLAIDDPSIVVISPEPSAREDTSRSFLSEVASSVVAADANSDTDSALLDAQDGNDSNHNSSETEEQDEKEIEEDTKQLPEEPVQIADEEQQAVVETVEEAAPPPIEEVVLVVEEHLPPEVVEAPVEPAPVAEYLPVARSLEPEPETPVETTSVPSTDPVTTAEASPVLPSETVDVVAESPPSVVPEIAPPEPRSQQTVVVAASTEIRESDYFTQHPGKPSVDQHAAPAPVLAAPALEPQPQPAAPAVTFAVTAASSSLPKPKVRKVITRQQTVIEGRHRFLFSQQPSFRSAAAVSNNPFRPTAWQPHAEDSESDSDHSVFEDDDVDVNDIPLRLHHSRINSMTKSGEKFASLRVQQNKRARGMSVMTFDRPRGHHAQYEANCQSTRRVKPNAVGHGAPTGVSRVATIGNVRLDEEAERALYGKRPLNALGEGIVLTEEAEQAMIERWENFFSEAESKMFTPLKIAMEEQENAQRLASEIQAKLMKNKQEQERQDALRLTQTRRESVGVRPGSSSSARTSRDAAEFARTNFRMRRLTRESCKQLQQEVQFGENTTGVLANEGDVRYFHLAYNRRLDGTILTVRLHTEKGDAELFMSNDTRAPCASDYTWRTASKSNEADDGDGKKVVLYPYDLARLEQVVAAQNNVDADAGLDENTPVMFYLSVVALAPSTSFSLSVMASGQKAEPSRAMQTVDTLIAQFNHLAKTLGNREHKAVDSSVVTFKPDHSREQSFGDRTLDPANAEKNSNDSDTAQVKQAHDAGKRFIPRMKSRRKLRNFGMPTRKHSILMAEDEAEAEESTTDAREAASFQQLLEAIGEKHGTVFHRSSSFMLSGPTQAHRELIEDEEAKLNQVRERLSPIKQAHDVSNLADNLVDATTELTNRRLARANRRNSRILSRLSPLNPRASAQPKSTDNANIRVAKFTPVPVAYSMSVSSKR
ncbi:TPA: hypothetical protein N0F65_000648 [Lagenidium giganteum]|uniref:Calmodulin n=1 Tax=Lagenidium giganteum TaxID=4803 RepID=A0AAV2YQ24_9STRA|nr:TPA: hypothetical protein N0F65_000648 [Lagenidium giganteum]